MNKLVILDRDGVINKDSDEYVKSLQEWIPIPGSAKAIASLSKAGYQVAIATNQSGLSRGFFDLNDLHAMHDYMRQLVEAEGGEIAGIFYCPHGPNDGCSCRKPLPGLIDAIEQKLAVTAKGAIMVGDSIRDLEAGISKGCRPILVKTGKGERSLEKLKVHPKLSNTLVYKDLADFVSSFLSLEQ